MVVFKMRDSVLYVARVNTAFVMYYFYGVSRSSLLIESTDSMITSLCGASLRTHCPSNESQFGILSSSFFSQQT